MGIPSGILDQQIVFDVFNPVAETDEDEYGQLITTNAVSLRKRVKRWAGVRVAIIDDESTPGGFTKAGTIVVTCRMDEFTRRQVNADIDAERADKLQWHNDWYSIVSMLPDVNRRAVDFTVTPTDPPSDIVEISTHFLTLESSHDHFLELESNHLLILE